MTEPLFPCTNALQTPNPPFWTTKTAVPKFPQNGGSTPTPCLDKAVHAQGGGGGGTSEFCMYTLAPPKFVLSNITALAAPGTISLPYLMKKKTPDSSSDSNMERQYTAVG